MEGQGKAVWWQWDGMGWKTWGGCMWGAGAAGLPGEAAGGGPQDGPRTAGVVTAIDGRKTALGPGLFPRHRAGNPLWGCLFSPIKAWAIIILITFSCSHWPFSPSRTSMHQEVFICLSLPGNVFLLWVYETICMPPLQLKHFASSGAFVCSVGASGDIWRTVPHNLQVLRQYFSQAHI